MYISFDVSKYVYPHLQSFVHDLYTFMSMDQQPYHPANCHKVRHLNCELIVLDKIECYSFLENGVTERIQLQIK